MNLVMFKNMKTVNQPFRLISLNSKIFTIKIVGNVKNEEEEDK